MKKHTEKAIAIGTSAITIIALYIAFQIFADIMAIKITSVWGLVVPTAVFIYPLTFTLRDVVHKVVGKKGARSIILISALLNIVMVLLFQFSIMLPPANTWGMQTEFAMVLGGVWRIVLASIVAEMIGQLVDTEAYSLFVNKITKKYQWARVLFSNLFSSPIDSFIFIFLAFYGTLPIEVLLSMVFGQTIIKWGVSLISAPLVYLTKDKADVEM